MEIDDSSSVLNQDYKEALLGLSKNVGKFLAEQKIQKKKIPTKKKDKKKKRKLVILSITSSRRKY